MQSSKKSFLKVMTSYDHYNDSALQSRTEKYRVSQGNPCNENRIPAMRAGFPVMNRFSSARIDLQGVPCKPYRIWVCSVLRVLCKPLTVWVYSVLRNLTKSCCKCG